MHPYWPLFDLRIRSPRLVLRTPTDADFAALMEAIDAGIHDPTDMPFTMPWTDAEPEERRRRSAQHWWALRSSWIEDDWNLGLAVFHEGVPIGVQAIGAKRFNVMRDVTTGSWLTRSMQGRGIGKEMRGAVLELAFAGLGAEVARSGAFLDNPASLAVSRALGYRDNGTGLEAPRGVPREVQHLVLTRAEWEASKVRIPIEIEGLEDCLPLFGLSETSEAGEVSAGPRPPDRP
jgi:RimJ/RimL family protein N-acetyltransferase